MKKFVTAYHQHNNIDQFINWWARGEHPKLFNLHAICNIFLAEL